MLAESMLRSAVRDVPDFPTPGVLFKDITPILSSHSLFEDVVGKFAHTFFHLDIDVVVGIESRGFILAAPVALELNAAFVPIRKAGKLPGKTLSESYDLEYGKGVLEIHTDAIKDGQRVLLIDDVLATGGTARGAASLVERAGGNVVGMGFLIEIEALGGRLALKEHSPVRSILTY